MIRLLKNIPKFTVKLFSPTSGRALFLAKTGDLHTEFEVDIIYSVSGVVIDAYSEVLPGVTMVFTEDLDPVLTDLQGYWQKTGLQEAIIVTPILEEYTFEFSLQRAERMNRDGWAPPNINDVE